MPSPARHHVAVALRRSAPPVAALSAVAISQPLLDLFGANPEFFVAKSMTDGEVVTFAAIVAVGVPLALMGLLAGAAVVSSRAALVVHRVVIAVLGATSALVLLGRSQPSVLVAALLAVAAGYIVAVAEGRYDGVRSMLRYLSPLPVLVLALFIFGSETSRLVWTPEAAAAPAETVASPAPVNLLVFDELPLASLVTPDGTINAERFPNFARLADAGTWYRNATSPYPRTEAAVPAIFSGTAGALGQIPSTIDYPRNLFTLLADSHQMNVTQEVTALCPEYACEPTEPTGSLVDRTVSALSDAAVVYGHRTLPESARTGLPPVSRSWGDFGDDGSGDNTALDPFGARRDDPKGTRTQTGKLAYFDRMIEAIEPGGRPSLNVAHGVFPHSPWSLTPEGNAYGSITDGLRFDPYLVWDDDPALVRQSQAQHLMQVGAADAALGRLIDRLEETGLWDESLVAVVADHGTAFEPGEWARDPSDTNQGEVFRVPMIVKYPQQREGSVDDDVAQTIDLVPTIVDALDVETSWAFDGVSLLEADRHDRIPTAVLSAKTIELDPTVDSLFDLADRNHDRFPYRDDWLGVVAFGPLGQYVGEPVSELVIGRDDSWSWTTDRWSAFDAVDDGFVPIQFKGTVTGPAAASAPDDVLLAVNGTVAGVGTQITDDGDGTWGFSTLLAEELFAPGQNTVELFVPDPTRPGTFSAASGRRDPTIEYLVDEAGVPVSARRGSTDIRVATPESTRLEIDAAFTDGRSVLIDGWAADTDAEERPLDIALFVDGKRVSSGFDPYPVLAQPTGDLSAWGFRLDVPASNVEAQSGVVVTVFEDLAVVEPVDWTD